MLPSVDMDVSRRTKLKTLELVSTVLFVSKSFIGKMGGNHFNDFGDSYRSDFVKMKLIFRL
jgi:hypothetical protein